MSYISANDLAQMKADQEALMDDTCTILLPGTTSNNMGGYTNTASTVATAVPCRFRVIQPGADSKHGYAIVADTTYVMTLPSTVSLNTRHQIVYSSTTYNVLSVNTKEDWLTAVRAEVKPTSASAI